MVYYPFRYDFGEASFLNINTGWGFPGVTSLGMPSAYTAVASILVRERVGGVGLGQAGAVLTEAKYAFLDPMIAY